MLDSKSRSDTIPVIDIKTKNVDFGHEAKIGRISDEVIFYLMSRGISELEAKSMVVRGFAEPVSIFCPGPANEMPVYSLLALSPFRTEQGYSILTFEPKEPLIH